MRISGTEPPYQWSLAKEVILKVEKRCSKRHGHKMPNACPSPYPWEKVLNLGKMAPSTFHGKHYYYSSQGRAKVLLHSFAQKWLV